MKKSLTPKRKLKPVELKHLASGETWQVPGDIYAKGGAAASKWIEQQITERKTAEFYKAEADRKAAEQAEQQRQATLVGERSVEDLLAEIETYQRRVSKLEESVESYKHRLQLKDDLLTDLGAAHELRTINQEPLEEVKRDMAAKSELAKRRKARNAELFDRIRAGEFVPESAFFAELPAEAPTEEASD